MHGYCDKMTVLQLFFVIFFLINKSWLAVAKELKCGFPGTPAYGFVKPDEAAYEEDDVVMYTCHVGYILLGSPISRCKEDGTWSEDIPICDDSMTTLVTASSTATVPGYPAEFAIDRNKEKCTYLQPKKPRWWRIDLGENKEYKVLSVAITMIPQDKYVKFTVFVIQIQDQIASYKRCGSFSGKFGTPTIVLSCAEGKGIEGHKVHIEDHNQMDGFFEICEVEIQVEKDTGYDCGEPSRSLYSQARKVNRNLVDYDCLRGYELEGEEYRTCLKSGQWSDDPPKCNPILCDELEPFENGVTQIKHGNKGPPLEGAMVIYQCNEGYKLMGTFIRNCSLDGSWSGKPPKCKAIRCPIPDGENVGGVYRLINKTNSMGSLALLRCKGGKMEGDNPYITCTADGVWTEPEAKCIFPARAAAEKRNTPRIVNQAGIIFGMVVAAIMIVVVLVGLYLYDQQRRNNKPEIPSRLLEPPTPPPRPPPRTKGNAFKSAFKGLLNRDSYDPDDSWKSQSLPLHRSPADDQHPSKKTFSYGESLPGNDDVIEVEVLSPARTYSPVPEETEDAAAEGDVTDADNVKDSSRKGTNSPIDYAAVDYEKKKQSRLLKEQDSMDSSSTAAGSPLPLDKDTHSPTPPKKAEESEEEEEEEKEEEEEEEEDSQGSSVQDSQAKKKAEEEARKAKEEEERKAKEEEERKAKEEEERKAKEEAEKKEASGRRRRVRDEPPPQVEERPVLRRVRKY